MHPARRRSGQSIIESGVVIAVTALMLFGLLQVGKLFVSREVLEHASSAGARARAVGFNDFMVHKVVRAASISNAGPLLNPDPDQYRDPNPDRWGTWNVGRLWNLALRSSPRSAQVDAEISRIPLYLGTERWDEQFGVLDYRDWDSVVLSGVTDEPTMVGIRVRQNVPLTLPFYRAFYADDTVRMVSEAWLANYAEAYLQ